MRLLPNQEARQYSDLKRQLAQEYPTDIEGDMDGKDSFIKEIVVKQPSGFRKVRDYFIMCKFIEKELRLIYALLWQKS